MATPLPSNFTILDAANEGNTIREIAVAANVAYLTPYYLVQRKENISKPKDVVVVTSTEFHQGADARSFLGLPTNTKTTLHPSQIPAGARVFVETSSHNRKVPIGSMVLLQTAAYASDAAPAPAAPAPTVVASNPAVTSADTSYPSPPKKRKLDGFIKAEESGDDDGNKLGSEVLRLRLDREGARSCSALQVSLIWNDIADLDLSCITPNGVTIYYGNKESECGGWLEVDMNVNKSTASTEPVENFSGQGKYVFRVTNFNCHTNPESTVFIDPNRSVPYRLFLTRNGEKEIFDGSVKHKEVQVCFEFELEGDGALGSFVVMPPSDAKTTFQEACEANGVTYTQGNGFYDDGALGSFVVMPPSDAKTTFQEACKANGVTYTQGSGFYALARKENISQNKVMLLQDIEKDTFTIGAKAVRKKLDWPLDAKQIRKGPKDLPRGFRLFVQSTSHNRLIPPGTHTLMKVSVKEALKHRAAHNTQFARETHTMGKQDT
eukprot:CAMPEP_0113596894 /NCGR_PEP_ID=MMETSP0015_2-20120614/40636_1 /TAXON_ID=2838 /ORGANISM="Odontella" /LENGTH=491 /DNA_ID=CAMNT_0000504553 /DNA_START=47 /DNA_END=1524 /DNA_ORIENTATION=+ /assembly_acc=CAM_ASM_000160